MIKIHHLRIGRSLFTVWLLEELGLDYEMQTYLRDPKTGLAQADLKAVHPLGKSPVIEVDGMTLAESGAITAYLIETRSEPGTFAPLPGDKDACAAYLQWLHYCEGSAFLPLMTRLMLARSGEDSAVLKGFAAREIPKHLGYIRDFLADKPFLMGDRLQGPDFGMTFILNLAGRLGELEDHPTLIDYVKRMKARPAFVRAVERGVE